MTDPAHAPRVGSGSRAEGPPISGSSPGVAGRRVLLLSGPNLDLLGERQPEIYGRERLADHVARAAAAARVLGLALSSAQHTDEASLVRAVQHARHEADALVVNAGALTHYSWALADALAAFAGPKVELHLSHPEAREPWRHTSVLASVVDGTIAGFGGIGYALAMHAVSALLGTGAGATDGGGADVGGG